MTILSNILMILSVSFFFSSEQMKSTDWIIEIIVIFLAIMAAYRSMKYKNQWGFSKLKKPTIVLIRYIGMALFTFIIFPYVDPKHTVPVFLSKMSIIPFIVWIFIIIKYQIIPEREYRRWLRENNISVPGSNYNVSSSTNYYDNNTKGKKEDKWQNQMDNVIRERDRKIAARKAMGFDD